MCISSDKAVLGEAFLSSNDGNGSVVIIFSGVNKKSSVFYISACNSTTIFSGYFFKIDFNSFGFSFCSTCSTFYTFTFLIFFSNLKSDKGDADFFSGDSSFNFNPANLLLRLRGDPYSFLSSFSGFPPLSTILRASFARAPFSAGE